VNKINYQKELDKLLDTKNKDKPEKLLLHACCAPCSSYCLIYLSEYFDITVLFYNPNITTDTEYLKRAEELKRFINEVDFCNNVDYVDLDYYPNDFYSAIKGYEHCAEGGDRCFLCYELRLRKTAEYAAKNEFDYFCTTLSISPLKNADKINEIGTMLSKEYNIDWLVSDFKKKNGFKASVELSKKYNLYRQDFCGCVFSKNSNN